MVRLPQFAQNAWTDKNDPSGSSIRNKQAKSLSSSHSLPGQTLSPVSHEEPDQSSAAESWISENQSQSPGFSLADIRLVQDPHQLSGLLNPGRMPGENPPPIWPVQAKLAIGQPGDRYEQEADKVAPQFVRTISPSCQCPVQRQEYKDLQEAAKLRLKVAGAGFAHAAGSASIDPGLESAIQGARGKGKPLSLQARAFTTGQDIFLRQGEHQPASAEGQGLLAHDLTHAVQQDGSRFQQIQAQAMGQVIQTPNSLEQDGSAERESRSSGGGIGASRVHQVNRTGLPDQLKAGIESLSGIDMSDVRVHANSDKPAKLNALAYTQGNQIDLGPGQERHLPHEAWHAVQQKQGRVRAMIQMKELVINDDLSLEHEADLMGAKAAQFTPAPKEMLRGKFGEGMAQKMDIHVGQERHLPHEAWHIVQKNKGWARPLVQMKNEITAKDAPQVESPGQKLNKEFNAILKNKNLNTGFGISISKDLQVSIADIIKYIYLKPKSVTARITDPAKKGVSRNETTISKYGDLGEQERAICGRERKGIRTYNGGHLIGHQFLGNDADIDGNLAPQEAGFNQETYRIIENQVENGYYLPGSPNRVPGVMKVTLYYPADKSSTLNELYDFKVITEDQYNEIKANGFVDGSKIDFECCVPDKWIAEFTPDDLNARTAVQTLPVGRGFSHNLVDSMTDLEAKTTVPGGLRRSPSQQSFTHILGRNGREVRGRFQGTPH